MPAFNPANNSAIDQLPVAGTAAATSLIIVVVDGVTSQITMQALMNSMGIYSGSGIPVISAAHGSLYLRSDGSSTTTRAYINTDGSTGWTSITTAT